MLAKMWKNISFLNRTKICLFIPKIFGPSVDKEKLPARLLTAITVLFLILAGSPFINMGSPFINMNSNTASAESNPYASDTTPPNGITNLQNITYAPTYINWIWIDPLDSDFSKVLVYLNGNFQTNVTNGMQYYNATSLTADSQYIISTQTIDTSGNINQIWVNRTARTAPATSSDRRTIIVNASGGADYTRIQDAIDNASAGDTILVQSSTYYESVNVNKQLTLRGMDTGGGKPVVDAGGISSAITLSSDGITLEGFKATKSGDSQFNDAGIKVISNNNTIIDNNASNNYYGIYLYSSSNNILTNNIANWNAFGIYLVYSSNNTLTNYTANWNSNHGIYAPYSNYNTFIEGTLNSNYYYGIYLGGSNNKIIDSTMNLDTIGIYLESGYSTLVGNAIKDNSFGIFLGCCFDGHNTIFNNSFNNANNYGLYGPESTTYVNAWNTTQTPGTSIIGGSYLGGNFWASPNGTGFSQTCADADRDGICDSIYVLDANNTDYLPLSLNFTFDTTPPAGITNLTNVSYAQTYINWTWTDPADSDFSKVIIYLNGTLQTNITNGMQYYNATGLIADTQYTISTHTIDTSGNINQTWINHTARTAPSTSGPRTIIVNASGSADYTRIQDAIDNASAGDTILVQSGTYYENVYVSKPLVLKGVDTGSGKPVVDASYIKNAIVINSDSVSLDGFEAKNSSDAGIWLSSSNYSTITNNMVSLNHFGINLTFSNNNIISNNSVSSNHEGLTILYNSNNNTITNNNASSNKYGIDLLDSDKNTLIDNKILNNDYGGMSIRDFNSDDYNIIYSNLFNNTYNIFIIGNINYNYWNITKTAGVNIVDGPYIGGNFWASPNGTGFSQTCMDADRDGICDLAYVLDANNTDYLPLSTPLENYGGVILDQSATPIFPNSCYGAFTGSYISQSFIPSISGKLTNISLALSSQNGVAEDVDLIVQIREQDGCGEPTCTPMATAIIPYFNTNLHWENVSFDNPPYIRAGRTYYIVAYSSTYYVWSCSYSYPNGTALQSYDGYNFSIVSGYDWGFQTYMQQNFGSEPVEILKNDTDGDGIYDICDRCPSLSGPKSNYGCPIIIIANLTNISYASTYINWTWTNPSDYNFSKVMVYLNGSFQTNLSKGVQYYNATNLTAETEYTISIRTVDNSDNISQTWFNHTAKTSPIIMIANITGFRFAENNTGHPGGWIITNVNVTNTDLVTHTYVIMVSGTSGGGYQIAGTATLILAPEQSINNIPVLVLIPPATQAGNFNLNASIWKLEDFPDSNKLIMTVGPITATVS